VPIKHRPVGSALTKSQLQSLQHGTMTYTYRGVETQKNPFDWALYPMLLWNEKPATIIELGSKNGGSALWMADLMRSFRVTTQIHSVDINPVDLGEVPGVSFHRGNARELGEVFGEVFLREMPRPLLVIEDSDHTAKTTRAVLDFFDAWLHAGEYIVVEDGIITEMGDAGMYQGGPLAAIEQFLQEHGADYEIDAKYCDWFGTNLTWNVNGFLKRIR
jgi:cephalosporin hydroxylase